MLAIFSTAAQASWREAQSPHFIIYGDIGERPLREFALKLEKFDSVMRLMWKVPAGADANPLTVLLVDKQKDVTRIAGDAMKFAAGFYRPGAGGSYIVAQRVDGGGGEFALEAETLLYHEYAHHFMMQYFPTAYPAWYVEGFAEFISTVDYDSKGHAMVGRAAMHRLPGIAAIKPLPLERILTGGIDGLTGDQIESFYGRSWLLTHYLTLSKTRKGQLTKYLTAINQGTPPAEALAMLGDLKALDKEIHYYFKDGAYPYLTLLVDIPDLSQVRLRDMRPAESALAIERLQYVAGIAPGDVGELRRTWTRSPGTIPTIHSSSSCFRPRALPRKISRLRTRRRMPCSRSNRRMRGPCWQRAWPAWAWSPGRRIPARTTGKRRGPGS
jgi:hypothetical protein